MEQHFFSRLPAEVLFYILKKFLDLPDLWTTSQVCRYLKLQSRDTLKKQWKIDLDGCSLHKIQAHAAMIALNSVSRQLIQRIKIYDPYAFPAKLQLEHILHELDVHPSRTTTLFPPTIEPGLDDIGNDSGFMMERLKYHTKRLHSILELETSIHDRILEGISSEKDMKNVIDILFHHAVVVSATASSSSSHHNRDHHYLACTTTYTSKHDTHAFTAITSRLMCRLDIALNCQQISHCLFKNMETYLTYMEYRLLAVEKAAKKQKSLLLPGIGCCMDLLGASYTSQLLDEKQALIILKKMCALLVEPKEKIYMLMDLKDVWLLSVDSSSSNNNSYHRDELVLFVKSEISKSHKLV